MNGQVGSGLLLLNVSLIYTFKNYYYLYIY